MIAAEDDNGPLLRAHTETGQVVRCQIMKTFIRQQAQLLGDPLWKVEPVQRVALGR